MIELTITAEDVKDLRQKLYALAADWKSEEPWEERKPKPEPKPAKKAKAAAPEKPVEAPPPEPVEDEEPYEVEIPEDGPPPEPVDTVANEKVKAEVIQTLQELFAQGKVKVVRHVLDNYGDGAKSFPEIEASKFPAIKEALARGIAA